MNYELHELCEIIPSMDDSEYLALVSDIRDNGLINPIIIFEGKIYELQITPAMYIFSTYER